MKAAFLYNFANFVEWPPDAFQADTTPITLCIVGEDPFGPAIDELVRGKSVGGHGYVTSRKKRTDNLDICQIVFTGESESRALAELFKNIRHSGTLTVGESAEFQRQGGQILFRLEEGKVRFAVNTDATNRAHLKVSSKLLRLATILHDHSGPKGS